MCSPKKLPNCEIPGRTGGDINIRTGGYLGVQGDIHRSTREYMAIQKEIWEYRMIHTSTRGGMRVHSLQGGTLEYRGIHESAGSDESAGVINSNRGSFESDRS